MLCFTLHSYILSGVIDILSVHITLPPKTSQLFFSITFWISGLLLLNHRGCHTDLHIRMHLFWMVTAVACAVFSLLRMIRGSHLLINMGLSSSLLIGGTWIIEIAFTLYNPNSRAMFSCHFWQPRCQPKLPILATLVTKLPILATFLRQILPNMAIFTNCQIWKFLLEGKLPYLARHENCQYWQNMSTKVAKIGNFLVLLQSCHNWQPLQYPKSS